MNNCTAPKATTSTPLSLEHRNTLGRNKFVSSLIAAFLSRYLGKLSKAHLASHKPQVAVFAFDQITHEIILNGAYESYELEIIFDWLTRHKLIRGSAIDVGANIGNHSLFFSRYYREVFSFEPNRKTFQLLLFNSGLANNIHCFNLGLSRSKATASLLQEDFNIAESRIIDGQTKDAGGSVLQVDLEALDAIPELAAEEIGLVKIDVEGHELSVLGGATGTIKKNMPIILFEQHPKDFINGTSPVIELLKSFGYARFATARSYPRLSRRVPFLLRIVPTVLLRLTLGYGFEITEIKEFPPELYFMIIAIPGKA